MIHRATRHRRTCTHAPLRLIGLAKGTASRFAVVSITGLFLLTNWGVAQQQESFDFAHRIVPLIQRYCAECHAGDQKKGGLSFNTRESMVSGGESGLPMLDKKNTKSELLARISSSDADVRMPPDGPLPAEAVETLREWIAKDAPWESGYTFGQNEYEPPLHPRRPNIPIASRTSRNHPIDRILDADRKKHGKEILPSVDDATFVRRAYLDLIGLLPTSTQTDEYVNDPSTNKRERLIRELLALDVEYAEHWLTFWNDLLRNDYSGTGFITGGRQQITKWLYDALVTNKSYDAMVRELIAPPNPESLGFSAGIRWRGEVSAGQTVEIQFAQNVGQAFLGINLKCASCHDSFIDRWTLQDSYGLAAIYSSSPLQIHRCDKPIGKEAKAAWLFPELGDVNPQAPQPERLQQLARLMTHPQNGRLARTIVNRMWHRLFGHGIVHPTDAMQNQPWNEDLLDFLAVELMDNGYDLKKLLYLIATSEAYQAQTEPIADRSTITEYQYEGPIAKRLTAEQYVDAVWQLTQAGPKVFDAAVIRGNVSDVSQSKKELAGKWIWADSANAPGGPAAGERVTFQKRFRINGPVTKSAGVVTCDNEYQLWVNGKRITEDKAWETVEAFNATDVLIEGENEILVVGMNGGTGPNPAALFLEMWIQMGNERLSIATGTDWQVTSAQLDVQGKFSEKEIAWRPAVEAKGPWDERLRSELAQRLALEFTAGEKMVRASLVKADVLMRSLGRPNRDQIVSVRPTELTTLEAMDLSNGQSLADWLAQGASRINAALHKNSKQDKVVDQLTAELYRFALSRPPSTNEQQAIREMVGDELEVSEIEDILWAIIMLPEFQFNR